MASPHRSTNRNRVSCLKAFEFQSPTGGVQVTHLWKAGISPIVGRAALREKQEQVTCQSKSATPFDQQSSK